MSEIAHTAHEMISGMSPVLQPGEFVFVTTVDDGLVGALAPKAIATFREKEGMSMLIAVEIAEHAMLNTDVPMCCITLNVFSSLEGVGLTAAVATALGESDIPCNMVAAFHHDHVFVPSVMSERAVDVLAKLQNQAARRAPDSAPTQP